MSVLLIIASKSGNVRYVQQIYVSIFDFTRLTNSWISYGRLCSLKKWMVTWYILSIYKECGTRRERERRRFLTSYPLTITGWRWSRRIEPSRPTSWRGFGAQRRTLGNCHHQIGWGLPFRWWIRTVILLFLFSGFLLAVTLRRRETFLFTISLFMD